MMGLLLLLYSVQGFSDCGPGTFLDRDIAVLEEIAYEIDPSEGRILNLTDTVQFCYNSLKGRNCIGATPVQPGEVCQGDALSLLDGLVFKIPNRTEFHCYPDECVAAGIRSSAIMFYGANIKKDSSHYGYLTFDDFRSIMGNKNVCNDEI